MSPTLGRVGSRRVAWAVAATGWPLVLGVAACSDPDPVDGDGRDAAIVEAAIRSAVEPPADDEPVPIVYVVAAEGSSFPVAVQADVAASLVDEVDLRFADDRVEALDEEAPNVPVVDDGTLLTVGEIPETGGLVEVAIERYRSELERDLVVVTLQWDEPDWTVTSTSVAPSDAG